MSSPQVIEALRVGEPINGEEGDGVLSESYQDAINAASRAVEEARGVGLSRKRQVYWITGPPGNGKTQSIRQLTFQLPTLRGAGKYAFAVIDFDKEPAARQPEALIPAIVRRTLSSGVLSEVNDVTNKLLKDTGEEDKTKERIAFGVDVISHFTGLPPISLFAVSGIKKILKYVHRREWYIKRELRKRWSANPQLLEFLSSWVRYVLNPTKNEQPFSLALNRLARDGNLFDLFCFALSKADYSTLVLIFDEVNQVALENLKPIWDPPERNTNRFYNEINLIMVLSAYESVYATVESNAALQRRFCSTPGGHFQLAGPAITQAGVNDDMTHVIATVGELLKGTPYRRRVSKRDLDQSINDLRRVLCQRDDVTWQDLWEKVIDVMVDLR